MFLKACLCLRYFFLELIPWIVDIAVSAAERVGHHYINYSIETKPGVEGFEMKLCKGIDSCQILLLEQKINISSPDMKWKDEFISCSYLMPGRYYIAVSSVMSEPSSWSIFRKFSICKPKVYSTYIL